MIPKHNHGGVATSDGDEDDRHHIDADDNATGGDGNSSYLHPERFSHSSMHSFDDFWSVSNPPPPKTLGQKMLQTARAKAFQFDLSI